MAKFPSQRKICNPGNLPDARYFGDRKTRLKRTRTEPLPGTKTLMPSTNDGALSKLVTANMSETGTCTTCKALGYMALGLSILLLAVSYISMFVEIPSIMTLVFYVSFVIMHFCVLSSQLMSDGKNGLGLLSLAIFYIGLVIRFMISSFLFVI